MTQLSDTQALILSAAVRRPKHIALPLPESLRGSAAAKVVAAMIAKGLLQEIVAATQWAPHTTRGFLSGALKKKLGLTITSEKIAGRGRAYRLT